MRDSFAVLTFFNFKRWARLLSLERAVCCKRQLFPTTRRPFVFFWNMGWFSLGMNPIRILLRIPIFSSFQGWCYGCHWSIRDKITTGGAFWPGKMQGKNIGSNIGSSFWGNCKRPSRRPQTRLARWIGKGEGYGEIFYSSQHFGTRVGELQNSFIIPIIYAQLSVAVYKKLIALCDFVWPCMLRWAEERCRSMMPSTATKLGGLCFKSFLLQAIMDARTSSISFWNLGIFGTRALKQWLK